MLTPLQIEAALKAFLDLYRDLRYSLSPRFEIELLFLRLSALPSSVSKEELIKRLEDMKKGIAAGAVVVKTAPKAITLPVQKENTEAEKKTAEIATPTAVEEIAPETSPADDPEEEMEEIVEKPFTITKEDLPAIAEALKKMGKLTPARYLSSIESIHEDGNFFCFVLSKPLAYNTLKNEEKSLSKAIAAALGESPAIKLQLEAKENEEARFSTQMKELKTFFGGTLMHSSKEQDTDKEIDKHATAVESVRTYEDDGIPPEPDEED